MLPKAIPTGPGSSFEPHHAGVRRRGPTGARLTILSTLLAATALLAPTAGTAAPARASTAPGDVAAANPYERGPAPTVRSIEAARGPFAIARTTVSRSSATGFAGGTIYYPTSTAAGTFGAVAIAPGYYGPQFSIAWYGPRLASQGFVVITINTFSLTDQPDSRASQLLAALDHLVQRSTVRDRVDPDRLGVLGHSMGGGGALAAARSRPQLQAAVPLTPWYPSTDFPTVRVPTLVIGAENDTTAPVQTYAEPIYTSLPATTEKAYLELNGASHTAPISANVTIAKYTISWLKRFIDDDVRYEQFLCPAPSGPRIQEYRSTCPHS